MYTVSFTEKINTPLMQLLIKGVWPCIPIPFVLCCLDVEAKGGRDLSDVFSSELLEDSGLACIVQPPGEKQWS